MADLITKYADKIDLDALPDIEMPEAETSVSASFFMLNGYLVGFMIWGCKIPKYFGVFGAKMYTKQ